MTNPCYLNLSAKRIQLQGLFDRDTQELVNSDNELKSKINNAVFSAWVKNDRDSREAFRTHIISIVQEYLNSVQKEIEFLRTASDTEVAMFYAPKRVQKVVETGIKKMNDKEVYDNLAKKLLG